ncbi:serine/threonine-protein kinase [Streptomyces sp. GS7]|uniref:serine/threonine-protein kinase n=1 Tax=Streptomyces sp. GS7 TaxID=2692234 RepID=UPI001316EB21|nr:serine/threonine-protein kinase [Streptomyces sp. GS7]QHC26405.1 protein kinase [Streptomyces sp. GS7]
MIAGRYQLKEVLGSGGFGRVWRARDEVLGVDVAIKEVWLPELLSDTEAAERRVRAEREAHNAAKLRDHPNIVAVHDLVFEDGIPWTVMRLVAGIPLDERLKTGPLSPGQSARVARALLSALDAVHAADMVHRDVKPANVLLATDGQILLTDFGIAAHEADTRMTATGMVIGSADYMAPERIDGTHDGPAGDLFSLGATLYEAVTGTSPFHRETRTATLNAICLHTPTPPAPPSPLAELITTLLNKNPEQRPTPAEALRMLDNSRPARTKPITAPTSHTRQEPQRGHEPGRVDAKSRTPKGDNRRKPEKSKEPRVIVGGLLFLLLGAALAIMLISTVDNPVNHHAAFGLVLGLSAMCAGGVAVGFGVIVLGMGATHPKAVWGSALLIGVAGTVALTANLWSQTR